MTTKIIPKPFSNQAEIDKSRKLTGMNKWARSSPTVGFIMLLLEWFTIPFEVIFRRDFGQRWLTSVNYLAGWLLLLIFLTLQYFITTVGTAIRSFSSSINPFYQNSPIRFNEGPDTVMILVMVCYFYLGLYHLFKIKWRNQANIPLHSFDDGTSRLEGLAGVMMWILNIVAIPLMGLGWTLIPAKQREGLPFPKFITDRTAFTNTVVEPGVVFLLAWGAHGTASLCMFISCIALFIHAHWREMAKKSKAIDFRDSLIEAQIMMELRKSAMQDKTKTAKTAAKAPKATPQAVQQIVGMYPHLSIIIEEMNKEKVMPAN